MIGDNIRTLRLAHNMTQEELGKRLGLTAMAISQWENGRAVPRMGAVEDMASLFGVKKSAIIDDVTYTTVTLSSDEDELLSIFRSMDSRARADLLNLARSLSAHSSDSISKAC